MKASLIATLAIAALLGAPAFAAPATKSPLLGRWALDPASLPMPPQARPKRVDLQFRETPDGRWTTRVDIVDSGGKTLHSESTLALDGTPGQASGSYWVDVVAAKRPAPDVLVMQFVYKGVPRSTRVYSLSEDGKVLTETEAYSREDGTPVLRTALFNRAAAEP